MTSREQRTKTLAIYRDGAPRDTDVREKINAIIRGYRLGKIKNYADAERVVLLLSNRSTVLKRSGQAKKAYDELMRRSGLMENAPVFADDELKEALADEHQAMEQRLKKLKRRIGYDERLVTVILYTTPQLKERAKRLQGDELTEADERHYRKYLNKKYKGLHQFWKGQLTVKGGGDLWWDGLQHTLVRRGGKNWKKLFRICLTDATFKTRELMAPGYVEAIYVLDHMAPKDAAEGSGDPASTAKRAAGQKLTIDYKYTCNALDLTKDTFEEAIKLEHYRDDECWVNALYDFYGDNLLSPEKKRNLINRETILDVLGRTEDNLKDGLRIEDVVPFFEKYKLKLRVYDRFYRKIFAYDPVVPNFNNKPMHVLVDGDHVYTLNHNIRSLEHKSVGNDDEDDEKALYVSNHYRVREREPVKHRMITHVDDILGALREVEAEQPDDEAIFLIHQDDNLEELLWQLHERGHTPRVSYQAGNVTGITMYFNGRMVHVKCQQLVRSAIDGLVHITDVNCYNRCDEAMAHCNNQIFRPDHKSYYTKEDVDVLNEYRTIANVGYLRRARSTEALVEIDLSKAYTKAFTKIDMVPLFNEFDVFRPYRDGEPIEDLSLYIVKGSERDKLFFNKERNLCYGLFLKRFRDVEILAVKKPSFLKKVNYQRIVEELYESFVSSDDDEDKMLKKQIANCNFGLLEKHVNKNHKSYIFESYAEAKFYQARYGGTINYIRQYEEREVMGANPLDSGLDEDDGPRSSSQIEFVPTDKVLYFLNIHAQADLVDGFRYIKELLLQHHNYDMLAAHERLQEAGVKVYTVKTDAFTIGAEQLELARGILDFHEPERYSRNQTDEMLAVLEEYHQAIRKNPKCPLRPARVLARLRGQEMLASVGRWRVSKTDGRDIKLPFENIVQKSTYNIKISEPTTKQIPISIAEEYDKDRLCEIFEKERRVLVQAEFAGSGKSSACKHMVERGHRVLFVCPTNKLCQEVVAKEKEEENEDEEDPKIKAVTVNQFFGMGITDESSIKRFDAREYDVVVFDEIYQLDTRKLARVRRYAEESPDKIVLATGDKNQLGPIEPPTNTHDDADAYMNHCVSQIFPKYLYLRENKRLKTEADKQKLKDFKQDIFDEGIPIVDTVTKYFPVLQGAETDFNIAYFNHTCMQVAMRTRRRMGKKEMYEVGDRLVCRAYIKAKKQGQRATPLYKNHEYKVTAVTADSVTLEEAITLPLSTVRKCFIYNYCRTCHSFQGLSVNVPITIYDWKSKWVDRKWIYTAVTRARQLDQVCFKEYEEVVRPSEEAEVTAYLRSKVCGYRQQDRRDGRQANGDNYVTVEWLRSCIGKRCHNCPDILMYERNDRGNLVSNITAQRINNDLAHELDNVLPFCVECNRAMSNREE